MESWYLYSLAALVLLGTQRFLYKVAAERGCSSSLTTAIFMATVMLLSSAVFFASENPSQSYSALLSLALVNSLAFSLATIANIEALKHLPAGITFPLSRLSLLVVILFSVSYFDEHLQPLQWFGVALVFSVVAILSKEIKVATRPDGNTRIGLYLVGTCILCGAIASISSKFAAESTSKAGFMALSYLFGVCFSLAIDKKWGKRQSQVGLKNAIIIGVAMGVLNFLGFYAFLTALSTGPLSSIALITGMHFVVAIILSVLVYHESMSLRRGLGIALTLIAVFFLRQ